MIKNIRGIEGDDIPYHLSLLGYDINTISDRYWFYPLNDHYNTHQPGWQELQTNKAKSCNVVVFYDLVNTGDYEHSVFRKLVSEFDHPNKVWLTVNQSSNLVLDGVKIIPWDFMWNRTKAYYTELIPENLYLHHYAAGQYKLPELNFDIERNKIILSMTGREYGYRTQLYETIKDSPGYISNRSRGRFLEDTPVTGAFSPVPNQFYLDSYCSLYVESNCLQSDLIHITEKTFDPLIKGHFVLPFTNPGAIQRLRHMGFEFPDFIDYSFDNIIDPETRFQAVLDQYTEITMCNIHKRYSENKHILMHNQQCINSIPYDNRILKVFDV
jgi:hypothetical protein